MSQAAQRRDPPDRRDERVIELEAKLAAISRSQAVIEFDLDGAVLVANERFLNAFGYSAAEVIGRHHSLFVEASTLRSASYAQFWERLRRGEYHSGEYKRIGKDGREVWIQATYNPIFDRHGKPFKVIKYAVDVTQAKLENANFSGQIEAIVKSQAVVEFELTGHVITANEKFLNVVGYTLDEVQGAHHKMFVDPDEVRCADYERFWCDLRAGQYRAGEYRRIGKDGQEVWLQASYNPIRDLNGAPFKIVKYAADVTEDILRKRQEATLRAGREAAEASAAAKSAFLADMSHELRTPLTSILGFSRLIAQSKTLSAADHQHLALIRSAGDTLLSVVNDILDFSKLEAGAMVLSPQPFCLSSLVEGVGLLLNQQAADKGLALDWRCDAAATLMGDASRLRQVLLNLVNNAIKFTSEGGVYVRAKATPDGEGMAVIEVEVEDTGIGLAPEACERLFNRFIQVDGSIARRFGGTGLGLAICREIVEMMGGEIGVRSREGHGSTFWLKTTLPVTQARQEAEPAAVAGAFDRPLRILMADDHQANRRLVSAVLEPFDIVLDTVENGEAAVEAASGGAAYDLILMDMQMPVMDGPAAARAIRKLSTPNRDTPIIALTANILPEQIALCRSAGMQAHLAKPIAFEALLEMVQRFCLVEATVPSAA